MTWRPRSKPRKQAPRKHIGRSGSEPGASRHVARAGACSAAPARAEDTAAQICSLLLQARRTYAPARARRLARATHEAPATSACANKPRCSLEAATQSNTSACGSSSRRRLGLVVRRVRLRALELLLKLLREPARRVSTRRRERTPPQVCKRSKPRNTRAARRGGASGAEPAAALRSAGAEAKRASGQRGGHALTVPPRQREPLQPAPPQRRLRPCRRAVRRCMPRRRDEGCMRRLRLGGRTLQGCAAMQP